jgi:hypothetical protein
MLGKLPVWFALHNTIDGITENLTCALCLAGERVAARDVPNGFSFRLTDLIPPVDDRAGLHFTVDAGGVLMPNETDFPWRF